MEIKEINLKFKNPSSKVLSGRKEGKDLRDKLTLDTVDYNSEVINVNFPDDIISLNSSFFLGLFGPSVRNLGKEEFEKKYIFNCPKFIISSINDGIERALKTSKALEKNENN